MKSRENHSSRLFPTSRSRQSPPKHNEMHSERWHAGTTIGEGSHEVHTEAVGPHIPPKHFRIAFNRCNPFENASITSAVCGRAWRSVREGFGRGRVVVVEMRRFRDGSCLKLFLDRLGGVGGLHGGAHGLVEANARLLDLGQGRLLGGTKPLVGGLELL
jgi:hypothetical protein